MNINPFKKAPLTSIGRPPLDGQLPTVALHPQPNAMLYEKIEGISTDAQLLTGVHRNGYNLNSVWED